MSKKIIQIIIFFAIGIVLFYMISSILMPEWMSPKYVTLGIRGFYKENKNTIDTLFRGDSNIYNGVSPIKIWKDTGITSYNYASSEQKIWTSYYLIKEALKYQKPKVIAIEAFGLLGEENSANDLVRQVYDNMPFSFNKLEAIQDPIYKFSTLDKISFVFPIIRYHSRWNTISEADFWRYRFDYNSPYKGYQMEKDKRNGPRDQKEAIATIVGDNVRTYMNKIQELCKQNDIQLFIIKIPTSKLWGIPQNQAIEQYAKEIQVPYIDLNAEVTMNWDEDTYDNGVHLNVYGAEKVSKYLGNYLKNNYNLQDHRNEEKYQDWNDDLTKYEEEKNEL